MDAVALDVRLFGQPDIRFHGQPVKLARRVTTLAMLALLILRRHQSVARTYLAFTLFPDHEEEHALNELRRYLYLAGKALPAGPDGESPIVADAETVRWNERCGAFVDAIAFEECARDPATHAQAVDLYGGDLLEDTYDDWAVAERERLRSLYLATLSALIECRRSERNYPDALAYANRLLIADPLREDVVRQIMTIRYASGDTPGAISTFDRFAKFLRAELGVNPMAETVALRESIALDRPLIGAVDGSAPARTASAAPASPFVGRESERELLHSRWDRAARGFGNCAFVGGEAGVGKTRLVGELARAVEREGGRVLLGSTSSPESSAYQCVTEALRSGRHMLAASGNELTLNVLARAFPEFLADAARPVYIETLTPDREAARLYDAFASALGSLAKPRPVLIVLEDLHWASTSTIDAIATMCRRLDHARVLIVGTYREEEIGGAHPLRPLLHALGVEQRMTDTRLARLDREHVERIVRAQPALSDAEPELVARLHAISEGNPLFLNEAIADALEGRDPLNAVAEHRAIGMIVASRIARLSDAAQLVAEIAAVCGHGSSVDVVCNVAGFGRGEVLAGFDELIDRRLVREAGAREHADFVFTHSLIRSSIYQQMDASARERRHARIARVMEKDSDIAGARELARHYDLGGLPDEAACWYRTAASEALAHYSNEDAVAFATHAVDGTTDRDVTIAALLLRARANALIGNRAEQARDLDLLRELFDAARRFEVLHQQALYLHDGDDRDAERFVLGELLDQATADNDPRGLGLALDAQAQFALSGGEYVEAKRLATEALGHLERAGEARERLQALSKVVEAEVSLGELTEADRHLQTMHDIAAASGDRAALCDALMQAASAATLKQDFVRVVVLAEEALEHFRVIGDRVGEARALSNIAMGCVRLSRIERARSANRVAAKMCEGLGDRRGLARVLMNLGMLHARCGDFTIARTYLAQAREHHGVIGDRRAMTASLLNESFIALWQGRAAEARSLALDALALAREMDHAAYVAAGLGNLGAAERDLGELDEGIAHMREGLVVQLSLGRLADGVGDLADIALAHAMRGEIGSACELADRIMAVDSEAGNATAFPSHPFWVAAKIFRWAGDDRAETTRIAAWERAQDVATSIDDPELRARFEELSFYQEMTAVHNGAPWPPPPAAARTPHAPELH